MISEQFLLEASMFATRLFELVGIAVIVVGAAIAFGKYAVHCGMRLRGNGEMTNDHLVASFRCTLGRSILTGLELLVAADIIRTVAVDLTLESVLLLGLIVLIRTFLSFSLEVEIEGRWPWQGKGLPEE